MQQTILTDQMLPQQQQQDSQQRQGIISRGIKFFDKQPYTIQLYYNNKHEYSSIIGGLLSLLFYCICIAILTLNGITFFSQTELDYNMYQIKNDFLTSIELDNNTFKLVLTTENNVNNLTADCGIDVKFSYQTNNSQNQNETQAGVVDNSLLGSNSSTLIFTFPKNLNLTIFNTSDIIIKNNITESNDHEYRGLNLFIKKHQNTSKICNFTAYLIFNYSVTNARNLAFKTQKVKQRIFKIRNGQPIVENQLNQLKLYFRKYDIQTDQSMYWPPSFYSYFRLKKPDDTFWHYNEEFTTQIISNIHLKEEDKNKLVSIKFYKSSFSNRFQRKYIKFSEFLNDCVGLIGLSYIIIMFSYKGYNKWLFMKNQLKPYTQSQVSNPDKVSKFFYKYLLGRIFKVCKKRKDLPKTNSQQIFYRDMDINQLIKRIKAMETKINYLYLQNRNQPKGNYSFIKPQKTDEDQIKQPLISEKND